jgi:hypothetical protein
MKTIIFLKTNKIKKVQKIFIYSAAPIKAYQIFVRLSLCTVLNILWVITSVAIQYTPWTAVQFKFSIDNSCQTQLDKRCPKISAFSKMLFVHGAIVDAEFRKKIISSFYLSGKFSVNFIS